MQTFIQTDQEKKMTQINSTRKRKLTTHTTDMEKNMLLKEKLDEMHQYLGTYVMSLMPSFSEDDSTADIIPKPLHFTSGIKLLVLHYLIQLISYSLIKRIFHSEFCLPVHNSSLMRMVPTNQILRPIQSLGQISSSFKILLTFTNR